MSNVREFGATGDGIADDAAAIQHAVDAGDGLLRFPAGTYRITRPIEVDLRERGPVGIHGDEGAATVVMVGSGPAFRISGSHGGTGDPGSVEARVWRRERLPTIRHLVVEGRHPEADGFQFIETMQLQLEGVLIRRLRHGIHLTKRNRNVLISHCHVYHNTGVGVFIDGVNLHQINITGNHISYNRLGGIRIERSEIRNLQITGNDIEYNNARAHPDLESLPTAEIYVDTTAEGSSVNEVTIASNTIQATNSTGGANIRIHEKPGPDRPPGLWAIAGNIIGSQENNIHLTACHGIVISGNCIYSCTHRNLLVERSSQINIASNSFRRHTPEYQTGVRLVDCRDCLITGCVAQDHSEAGQSSGASLLELEACERITVTACQWLDGVPFGIDANDCRQVHVAHSTIADTREAPKAEGALRFRGRGSGNRISFSILGGEAVVEPEAGVIMHENDQMLSPG